MGWTASFVCYSERIRHFVAVCHFLHRINHSTYRIFFFCAWENRNSRVTYGYKPVALAMLSPECEIGWTVRSDAVIFFMQIYLL